MAAQFIGRFLKISWLEACYHLESDILVAVVGLKAVAVRQVNRRGGGAIPGTTAYGTALRRIILVPVVVGEWLAPAIGAKDGLSPFGHIAGHVINAITVGLICAAALLATHHSD